MDENVLPAAAGTPPRFLPQTTLIICSRNRPTLLADTVASILAGDELPAELVIVDQSDAPHSSLTTLVGEHGCTVIYRWSTSRGLSRANNEGIAAARHDLLVFTHDDVFVAADWFGALVRTLVAAGERALVTGQVRPTEGESAGGFQLTLITEPHRASYLGRIGRDVLYPLNMAVYRAAFAEIGGFDERLGPGTPFPAAEDNDFSYRTLEAGYRIVYDPAAVLYHRAWRPPQDYRRLRWAYGRGNGAYYAKYFSLHDPHMLKRMRGDLERHIRRLRGRLWAREWHEILGDLAFVGGLISGAVQWLLTQRLR